MCEWWIMTHDHYWWHKCRRNGRKGVKLISGDKDEHSQRAKAATPACCRHSLWEGLQKIFEKVPPVLKIERLCNCASKRSVYCCDYWGIWYVRRKKTKERKKKVRGKRLPQAQGTHPHSQTVEIWFRFFARRRGSYRSDPFRWLREKLVVFLPSAVFELRQPRIQ